MLRFIGAIDADGKKTPKAATVFAKHEPAEFQKSFEEMIKARMRIFSFLHGMVRGRLGATS